MKKIASHNKYSQYLSMCSNISSVEVLETGSIKCNLLINNDIYSILLMGLDEHRMPIVLLCDPKEGEAKKPHQMHLKKSELILLCLSVRDDISVKNRNYKEIIDYTLKRVVRLLSLNEAEERREFRKEFLYFWNKASVNKEKVNLYINTSKQAKKLFVYKKKQSLIIYDNNVEVNSVFKKDFIPNSLDAIYIPLINSSRIMPPFEDKNWDKEYLKEICNNCIGEENLELLESITISTKSIYIVFEMDIHEALPATFLLVVGFSNNKVGNLFERIKDAVKTEHLSSQRCDSDYLFNRIGMRNFCKNKNVLVIGAGSLGSYIISELPKIGVNKLTIFDDDDFSIENTMRHQLDLHYNGYNKALAMKFELELNYPELVVEFKSERFLEKKLSDYSIDEFDLIIVTTGGTDFMLRLNKQFKDINLSATVIFSWIEANGIGVHALPINYSKKGCYQCLYTKSEVNKAHYCNQNSDIKVIGTGCGGVFNSYGNLTLLKGSSMILELVQLHLSGQLKSDKNLLYSIKTISPYQGNTYILSRRNFETSKDFYIDERCEVCGTCLQNE